MNLNAYHVLFGIVLILGIVYDLLKKNVIQIKNRKIKISNVILAVAGICLILFSGLVGDITSDHSQYIYIYNNIKLHSFKSFFQLTRKIEGVEAGYGLLLWIIGNTVDNEVLIFIVSSTLVIVPIILFAKKTKDPFLFLILFLGFGYYFASFNVIRQTIVASLFLLTFNFIKEGKYGKYFFSIVLISLFQITALFMLVFYKLLRQKKNVKTILKNIIIVLIGILGMNHLINFFDILWFHGKYSQYRVVAGNIKNIIIPIFLFLLFYILKSLGVRKKISNKQCLKKKRNTKYNNVDISDIIYNASIYWLAFWIMFVKFSYLERLTYFFIPLVLFGIVEIICNYKNNKKRRIIKICVICIVCLYYFKFGQYPNLYKLYFIK